MARCYLPDLVAVSIRRTRKVRNVRRVAAFALGCALSAAFATDVSAQYEPAPYAPTPHSQAPATPAPFPQAFSAQNPTTTASGLPAAANPIAPAYREIHELDPVTLEPVGFHRRQEQYVGRGPEQVHPLLQSWGGTYSPRYRSVYKAALKDSLRGFYGGVEYVHYDIHRPSNRVLGNYRDLPDFNEPDLAGYVSRFGPDPATGLPFIADPQFLVGTLTPGTPINVDPLEPVYDDILEEDVEAILQFSTDIVGANPFFPLLTGFDLLDSANAPSARLLGPSSGTTSFNNKAGMRGTLGYEFGTGTAIEFSVTDIGRSSDRIAVQRTLNGQIPLVEDNTTGTGAIFAPNGRTDLVYIPIVISDLTFDLPGDGIGTTTPDPDPTDGILEPDIDVTLGNANPLDDLGNLGVLPLLPLYFDGGFALDYSVDINQAEANVFVPFPTLHHRLSWDFSFGFRYMNVDEALTPALQTVDADGNAITVTAVQTRPLIDPLDFASGTFPNFAWDPVNGFPEVGEPRFTTIAADVENNLYAAQLGFRTELDLDHVTLGLAPKLAFGGNDASASVTTSQLLRATDPTVTRYGSWDEFATIFDLSLYVKCDIREWVRATIGYQFIYADGLAHAPDTIDFTTTTTDPGLGILRSSNDLTIQGLTIGLEFFYP